MPYRNCVSDTARLAQCIFLRGPDKHHVDDSNDISGFRVVDGAAAIAWIADGIELVDIKRSARQPFDLRITQLAGGCAGYCHGGDRRDDCAVGRWERAQDPDQWKSAVRDGMAFTNFD